MTHKAFLSDIFLFFVSYSFIFSQTDLVTIPFRNHQGAIVVEGTVDGRPGNLIIDTGIAKMLLNRAYSGGSTLFTTKDFGGLQSINGADQNGGLCLVILEMGDFSTKTAADIIDLEAVEQQKGMDILGVVGLDLFHKYELEIDFFSEELRLYRLDNQGNRRWQEAQPLPSQTLPFRYEGHLLCITANLYGQPLQLGLDTWAGMNVFSDAILERSDDRFHNLQTKKIMDLNGQQTAARSAQTAGMQIGGLKIPPMTTLFVPMNTHYGGLDGKNIQGLLGYEFFRHFRTAINFKKREVYLWDEQAVEDGPVVRN